MDKLLQLYRLRRSCEERTLEGYIVKPSSYHRKMQDFYTKEIDILSAEISAKAKTRIKKESKERGIPYYKELTKKQ